MFGGGGRITLPMNKWQDFPVLRGLGTQAQPDYQPGFAARPLYEDDDLGFDEFDPELDTEIDRALADKDILAAVLAQTGEVEPAPAPRAEPRASAPVAWTLPGFEGSCRVTTNFGELPIQALRKRDMVKTISGAYREVKWIDAIRLDEDFMTRHPGAHPLMIRAKALGGTFPVRNMLVSPAQQLWVPRVGAGFSAKTAADLEGTPNIHRMRRSEIVYYRFHCGDEEKVCIEGAWFCTAP